MRLKRLVARGFKSFADRTEFEFDSRLTGIIGPNGCGKSNVVDAIKWVLGDQRARSLRGTEMTDVIFKGAEGRQAMGIAEVVITFEDPEGRFDGRTEIDIGRRLTLDKESTYLVNGQEVRLKDVRDVLLDTGLGTGGYSVMEQGRIDAVLSANPEARRAIFEEAAGIARFKLQKKEALRRLERTDQNLARITDLIEERGRRIRSLRIQAGKARRFHELQAALRDLRTALAVVDGTQLRKVQGEQRQQLAALQLELERIETTREELDDKVRSSGSVIAEIGGQLEVVRLELGRCQDELTTHRERAKAQAQRALDLGAEAERSRQRGLALAEQHKERAAALDETRGALAGKEQEIVDLHRRLDAARAETAGAQQELRALQRERETMRGRQLELLHERTRARNLAADQDAALAAARARRGRLGERLQVLAGERGVLATETARLLGERQELQTRERILHEREQRALDDLHDADAAAAELAAREAQLRKEHSQVDGRHKALLAMEAHMEGLDEAPRHVLQQAPPGLRGRLLDLLDVDLNHSRALEAALGPYVQALVVASRGHAEAIVADLQQRRLGRVLLLVEEEFGAEVAQPSLLPLPVDATPLIDLVRPTGSTAESRRLLSWLLRGVVVVPTLAAADPTRADLCFVTPDGALLCGPRVEGGAAAEGHAGLVVRRSQILELGSEAARLALALHDLEHGKDRAVSRVERLKRELRLLGAALQQGRRELQAVEAGLSRAAARDADVQREIEELQREAAELQLVSGRALAMLARALFDQVLIGRRERALQLQEEACAQTIATAAAAAEAAARHEQELRLDQAQATEAREGLLRTIGLHEEALREFDTALEELADQVQQSTSGSERATAERERLLGLAGVVQDRMQVLEQQRDGRQAELDGAERARREVLSQLEEQETNRRRCAEALGQVRLEAAESEHRFARIEERLREDCGIELRRCLGEVQGFGLEEPQDLQEPPVPWDAVECLHGPPLPPDQTTAWRTLARLWEAPGFDVGEARKEVQQLQSQKERLGAVNLEAVQELGAEEGQFAQLEQEVRDLKEARRALMETLRKLETESRTLFEQTFAEARKNFQDIFRKLFQGGRADMYLGNTEDLLEAGIEIVAQPPGKQLQSINLLSGGERSLTAVAILFALFKVRPSPFCILDEVDAALDETNVERFLRVLRDFTSNTQFCIVTHHKRTMAECQVLYGITMQRRGVSSRIAVALHEVDHFQDAATATAGGIDRALQPRVAGEEHIGF